MPSILETRQRSAANDLQSVVKEIETFLGSDDADTTSSEYVALRESREAAEARLADLTASLNARRLAETPAQSTVNGEAISEFRRVLREYDRGNSQRVSLPYVLRELQTGDPHFTPNPSRISVGTLPVLTPSLDVVSTVQTGNTYDFTVPPPPEAATTTPEGSKKRTIDWVSSNVSGTLETDALIIDVTRQTLEDDASAESTLRTWLVDGVRLKQDAKVQAAIAGATGTQTATGATIEEALRKGKSALSGLGITATAAYLHPDDAADLDMATIAATGLQGNASAWNMRVIESPAIAVGAPIVGSMAQAVYLLYRNAIQTYLTDSGTTDEVTPRDRFSHNLLGILGEGRSKAHVVQPALLCKCTVTP